jgi:energy-coupling factor transporter ATP-binding protein EcfA2
MTDYKYPPGERLVRAIYSSGQDREFDSNPLISALQVEWTSELIAQAMTWWPEYSPALQKHPAEERETYAHRLVGCFETLPEHLAIVKAILRAIKFSLIGRDRYVHAFTAQIRGQSAQLSGERRLAPPPDFEGMTILLYGLPGNGKSTLLRRLEVLLPQIIDHATFHGNKWPCRQVVFIRVAVKQNWTDRALAQSILEEFDRVAGSTYARDAEFKGRASLYTFLLQLNLAAHNHGLGAIFVDEVQLLANNETLLNFLLNFNTMVRVPLILVGTPASQKIMQSDPRFMRRADGVIDPEFKRFDFMKCDEAAYNAMLADHSQRDRWTHFVEAFWDLQYTQTFAPFSYKLSFTLHYFSCGIIDYAIKLFVAAQLIRIGSSKDELDEDAFKEAYFHCFKTSMDYLEALREGRTMDLRKYEDFARIDMKELTLNAAKARHEVRMKAEQNRLAEQRKEKKRSKRDQSSKTSPPDPVGQDELPEAPMNEFEE